MSEKKKKSGSLMIAIVAIVALAGVAAVASNIKNTPVANAPVELVPASDITAVETTPAAASGSLEALKDAPAPSAAEDIAALTTPRILGNPDAPLKIAEHSSFSCGACAQFHKTNFKEIKRDYIDTGKAYIVFDDFPRNDVDIVTGSLARCIQGDAYFNFVQLLFETQSEWIGPNYQNSIKQNAIIAGLTDQNAEACMNNKAVHEALAANRQATQEKFGVSATPTLILNDQSKVPGLLPYEELKKAIDEQLAKIEAAAPAAAEEPVTQPQ